MSTEKTEAKTSEEVAEQKTWKDKLKETGVWALDKVAKGVHWCAENSGLAVPIVIGGINLLMVGAKIISGDNKLEACKSEDQLTGETLLLTRPMANDDVVELSNRMEKGETKAEALNSMGLLRDERRRKF